MCACQMAIGPLTAVRSLGMRDVDFLALNANNWSFSLGGKISTNTNIDGKRINLRSDDNLTVIPLDVATLWGLKILC